MNGRLTEKDEEKIIYIRNAKHKAGLFCENIELLIKCYNELKAEREKSKQLLNLCEICKERR